MRAFLAAAAALTILAGTTTPSTAGLELSIGFGQIYVSGHAKCGCPIYTKRTCRGHDRHGHPVFGYERQPFHCRCKGPGKHPKHGHSSKHHQKNYKKFLKEREKHYKKNHKGKKK